MTQTALTWHGSLSEPDAGYRRHSEVGHVTRLRSRDESSVTDARTKRSNDPPVCEDASVRSPMGKYGAGSRDSTADTGAKLPAQSVNPAHRIGPGTMHPASLGGVACASTVPIKSFCWKAICLPAGIPSAQSLPTEYRVTARCSVVCSYAHHASRGAARFVTSGCRECPRCCKLSTMRSYLQSSCSRNRKR